MNKKFKVNAQCQCGTGHDYYGFDGDINKITVDVAFLPTSDEFLYDSKNEAIESLIKRLNELKEGEF